MRLHSHLFILALSVALPLVALAVFATSLLVVGERQTMEREAIGRARAAMTAIDAELRGHVETAKALGSFSALAKGDLRAFHEEARHVLRTQRDWLNVGLMSVDGAQVVDAILPFGKPTPASADPDDLRRVIETGQPAIGNVAVGAAIGPPAVRIRVPVGKNGGVRYVISVLLKPERFTEILREQRVPPGWIIVLVDRNRRFIARIPHAPPGNPISPSFAAALDKAPEGWFRGSTIEGFQTYTPYVTSSLSGWTLGIAIPAAVVEASQRRAMALMAGGLIAALILAFGLAMVFGARISFPMSRLAEAAISVGAGAMPPPVPATEKIRELSTLDDALRRAHATISEREDALRRQTALLEAVNDGTSELIFMKDRAGRLTYTNAATLRAIGMTAEQALGSLDRDNFARPEEHEAISANDRRVLETGQTIRAVEEAYTCADGQQRVFLSTKSPLCDESGAIVGVIGVSYDITDRKQAEQALREADRHKDEFLAMLSHELRNPLVALTTAAHVLRAAAPDDRTTAGAQGVIDRQTQHMVRLIEDLLDITRVRLGKLSLKRESVNLAEFVGEVTEAKRAAGALEGRAAVDVEASPVWVQGDRARVEQIYSNLLDNALKFTPSGGTIHVGVRRNGQDAVLTVADNGRGIDANVLPRIFDLFVQAEQTLDRAQGGLGLGLALVRRLAELHGGRVGAASDGLGHGAIFTVTLPAVEAPSELPGPAAQTSPPQWRPLKILVVEDNQDARQMLRAVLAMKGHEVVEAATGAAGVAAAAEMNPDVVLLDIGLPDIDGYEVARRLRAGPGGRSLILVAVSGYGQEDDRGRARAAGFDAHVVKPAGADEIARVVADLAARNTVSAT